MSEQDWLTLPGEEQAPEKNPDRPEQAQIIALPSPPVEPALPMQVLADREPKPLPVPKKGSFADLWRQLLPRQRVYLEQLAKSGFNIQRAIRGCKLNGHKIDRHTPLRWKKTAPYAKVYEMIEQEMLGQATNPAALMLKADEILNLAMQPKRVYTKDGRYTGTRERQLDTALRANEQKMKATGMLRADERSTRVTVRLVNLAGLDGQKVIDGQAVEVETE